MTLLPTDEVAVLVQDLEDCERALSAALSAAIIRDMEQRVYAQNDGLRPSRLTSLLERASERLNGYLAIEPVE